jgi:epoxyqueuosine reductase QueG
VDDHLTRIRELFAEQGYQYGLAGMIGVASLASTVKALLPVQQKTARDLLGNDFDSFVDRGSVICLAYAYPESAIDAIATRTDGGYDKQAWNYYAREYRRVNAALTETAQAVARLVDGAAVDATLPGMIKKVAHIEEYYPLVISHRVAAELSGVGWRGKHQLIVNPRHGCAIRLASILTRLPLERTPPCSQDCGSCRACLDACPFLREQAKLDDYREQCRRYIIYLNLEDEVCGKCVKACYRESVFKDQFAGSTNRRRLG